jgi:ribonuclease HI
MGNHSTKLDLDPYFKDRIVVDDVHVEIVVRLDPPALNKYNDKIDNIVLRFHPDLSIDCDTKRLNINSKNNTWSPKSHMRDFEVIDPHTNTEVKIARGQGIGVVIIESLSQYVKLMYDKNETFGVRPASYSLWNHTDRAREVLSSDLSLGYDVLFITKDNVHYLCEDMDESDKKDTLVIFPECRKYARYEHSKESKYNDTKSKNENLIDTSKKDITSTNTINIMKNIYIYTDGSSQVHTKERWGGWGVCVVQFTKTYYAMEQRFGKREKGVTNNNMELTAILNALKYINNKISNSDDTLNVYMYIDNQYCIKGMVNFDKDLRTMKNVCDISGWLKNWTKNGWKSSTGDVKNVEEWKEVYSNLVNILKTRRVTLHLDWVKSHTKKGDSRYHEMHSYYNSIADKIANGDTS